MGIALSVKVRSSDLDRLYIPNYKMFRVEPTSTMKRLLLSYRRGVVCVGMDLSFQICSNDLDRLKKKYIKVKRIQFHSNITPQK